MGETLERNDFMANRGVPLIDDLNDLCPGNVGGQIVAIPFTYTNLAAGVASPGLASLFCALAGASQVPAPKAGSIVGMSVMSNVDLTAGTANFIPTIAGTIISPAGVTVALSDTVQSGTDWQNKDVTGSTFAAGALLGVNAWSDGALAPATADYAILLFIEI
jgi:hypothetical protein